MILFLHKERQRRKTVCLPVLSFLPSVNSSSIENKVSKLLPLFLHIQIDNLTICSLSDLLVYTL